ncbi:MAG: hypothetical protein ACO35I_08205, partial [Burkholderiaceae bacterium]
REDVPAPGRFHSRFGSRIPEVGRHSSQPRNILVMPMNRSFRDSHSRVELCDTGMDVPNTAAGKPTCCRRISRIRRDRPVSNHRSIQANSI